jgi:hypothetical protein
MLNENGKKVVFRGALKISTHVTEADLLREKSIPTIITRKSGSTVFKAIKKVPIRRN